MGFINYSAGLLRSLISGEAFLLSGRCGLGAVFRWAFAGFFSFCPCEEERRDNLVAVQSGLTSGTLAVAGVSFYIKK